MGCLGHHPLAASHHGWQSAPAMPMEKTFDPAAIEAKWAQTWENRGLFRPARPDAQPFTIVNPPPNVTGALHIGHALDNRSEEHTSELQSLMRISYAAFCLKKQKYTIKQQ